MDDRTFHQISKQTRVEKITRRLFVTQDWFCISDFRELGELLGINVRRHPDYDSLHNFHCIHWKNMDSEVAKEVRFRAKRVLGLDGDIIDVEAYEVKPSPPIAMNAVEPQASFLQRMKQLIK